MPGPTAQKNQPLQSAAVGDLGLGDALNQQLQDALEESKKKMLSKGVMATPNLTGLNGLGGSMAVQQLYGQDMKGVGSMSLG